MFMSTLPWQISRVTGLLALSLSLAQAASEAASGPTAYTRLLPLPPPVVVSCATPYAGGAYEATNLVDGRISTEYSSAGLGTNTFVDFAFGRPVKIAAFRHRDRNDPATISASLLMFLDEADAVRGRQAVEHVNQKGGITFATLPAPVQASKVRWIVTGLGPQNLGTVGGAEVAFYTTGESETSPSGLTLECKAPAIVERRPVGEVRPLRLTIDYPYLEPVDALLKVGDGLELPMRLQPGANALETSIPSAQARFVHLAVLIGGKPVIEQDLPLKAVRPMVVYILPHSHTDIGYTEIQTAIEEKQMTARRLTSEKSVAARTDRGGPTCSDFAIQTDEGQDRINRLAVLPIKNCCHVARPRVPASTRSNSDF